MPDFRVADTAAFDEKMVAAGNAAVGLWTRAGAWCMHNLTDGHVPTRIARQIGSKTNADRLVSVGLWVEVSQGYEFCKWDGYQRSKEQVESERAAARTRMKRIRSGEQRKDVRANSDAGSPERTPHVRDRVFATPFPSLPVPSPSGYVEEAGYVGDTRDDDTPPPPGNHDLNNPRCPKHVDIPADDRGPNCRACKNHRIYLEQAPARTAAHRSNVVQDARMAIRACPDCDENGMREVEGAVARCDHGHVVSA